MINSINNVEVSFTEQVQGAVILDVLRQEYLYEGSVVEEANVIYMRLDNNKWLRFFFDAGVFFWRKVDSPDNSSRDEPYSYQVIPISEAWLKESTTEHVEFMGLEGEVKRSLTLLFRGGGNVSLHNFNDNSTLIVNPPI